MIAKHGLAKPGVGSNCLYICDDSSLALTLQDQI
jgi:hypothetical protein